MKSVKRVSWLVRGKCPQLEFERVLNLDEVEIVHTSYSTLLWTEWLSRLVVHREWVDFTMGVDFAKFWKMSKLERMQNQKEGSVLSMDLKGFWILKRSSFGVRSNGRVQCPSTLLPSSILGPLRKCTVGGRECEKCKVRKGWKGKEEEVKCSTNLKGFWIWRGSSFGVRSYGRVQCPSTLLPSSSTDWLVWKGSLWKMWKTQSPKRTS